MPKLESDTEETTKPTISKYGRYMIQDFDSHRVFVDIEVFMKHVLRVPVNWKQEWADVIHEIRADCVFTDARCKYNAQCEKSGFKEEDFYKPLVSMVNAIFKGLSTSKKVKMGTGLCCLRNDPRKIIGRVMSELVPNVVTVHKDFLEEISGKEKKEGRLTDTNLTWAHPIQMIEVKPGGNLLVDGSQMRRLVVNGEPPTRIRTFHFMISTSYLPSYDCSYLYFVLRTVVTRVHRNSYTNIAVVTRRTSTMR